MIKIIFIVLSLLFSLAAFADTHVNGYYKKNGTYVEPHYRSSPNGTTLDNFSTKGNINPYTGKEGTRNPTDGGSSTQQFITQPSNDMNDSISESMSQENKNWLNQSCPKSLGPSLWKNCINRESAALGSSTPNIESMSQENKNWLNQSCPKSLGPSLWKNCINRESAALR